MKKMKRIAAVCMAVVMGLGLMACGAAEFDAAGYTKAAMDASFKREYKEYAKFRDLSEEEAEAEVTDGVAEQLRAAFAGQSVSDEAFNGYMDVVEKAYDLAKYEVKEAKKQDDGNYIVTVAVSPSNVFQLANSKAEEVATEYVNGGQDLTAPDMLANIMVEAMNRAIAENEYGEESTMEVHVNKNGDNAYGIENAEMLELESALFPTA